MADPIRILIADAHAIVRSGLRALMETVDGIDVIGEAADGQEAVKRVLGHRPDVVLMDLEMPVLDGIQAIGQIVEQATRAQLFAQPLHPYTQKLFAALPDAQRKMLNAIPGSVPPLGSFTRCVRASILSGATSNASPSITASRPL